MADVRVRLTAEGVSEVVGALRRVQTEGQRTGQVSGRGFGILNSALGTTTRLLGTLGLAVGAGAFVSLVRSGSELAEEIQKLGGRIGTTTERTSALALVARDADVDLGGLQQGIVQLNKRFVEAREGSGPVRAAFRALGVDLNKAVDLDAAQRLELVADAFSRFEVGPERSAAALRLFGRAGAQMIPILEALAEEGLEGAIARARELGVLFDDEVAAAADKLNDRLGQLNLQVKVLAGTFAAGLSSDLVDVLNDLSDELRDGQSDLSSFAKFLGGFVEVIVAGFLTLIDLGGALVDKVVTPLRQAGVLLGGLTKQLAALARGDFAAANQAFLERSREEERLEREFQERRLRRIERVHERAQRLKNLPVQGPERAPRAGGGDEELDVAERRLDATRSALEAETRFAQLQARLRGEADRRAFREGLVDLQEFFRRRRAAILSGAVQEAELLTRRRTLAEGEDDPVKRAKEIGDVDARLKEVQLNRAAALAETASDEREAVRKLADERLSLERRILEAQGSRHAAALRAIDEEVRRAQERLAEAGAPPEERRRAAEDLRRALTVQEEFEERIGAARAALDELSVRRSEVEARASAGLFTQLEANEELLRLERDRAVAIRGLAEDALVAARATGDPERIAQAEVLLAETLALRTAASLAEDSLRRFKDSAQQAAVVSLTDWLSDAGLATDKFSDSLRELGFAFAQTLRRMAAEIVSTKIIQFLGQLLGLTAGIGGGGGGEIFDVGGDFALAATGGLVVGPGTGTSDTAGLFALSRDEYVVPAAAVRRPGVLSLLESLRAAGARTLLTPSGEAVRGMAGGGLVAGAAQEPGTARAGRGDFKGRLTVGLRKGLVLEELDTPEGHRFLVEVLGKNRRVLHAAGVG